MIISPIFHQCLNLDLFDVSCILALFISTGGCKFVGFVLCYFFCHEAIREDVSVLHRSSEWPRGRFPVLLGL